MDNNILTAINIGIKDTTMLEFLVNKHNKGLYQLNYSDSCIWNECDKRNKYKFVLLNDHKHNSTIPADTIEKINQRATAFTKENGYYFYNRIQDDVVRYDNVKNIATYTATMKFK